MVKKTNSNIKQLLNKNKDKKDKQEPFVEEQKKDQDETSNAEQEQNLEEEKEKKINKYIEEELNIDHFLTFRSKTFLNTLLYSSLVFKWIPADRVYKSFLNI